MKGSVLRHTIGLFLVSILLFKSAATLIVTFSIHTSSIAITEALPEEEKKSKAENAPDEFTEKALLPVTDVLFPIGSSSGIHAINQLWQDVYLDTLTPPPNRA
jgi:hypothetical protein